MSTIRPEIKNMYEEDGILHFTLSGVDVSIANSIRRTILSTIPTVVFRTETYETKQCVIDTNTGRLHDQMVEQRLGCIPIHHTGDNIPKDLVGNYLMEVNIQNTSDSILYVTTEHFRVKNKQTGDYLSRDIVMQLFPPDEITRQYIILTRLRPQISDTIPGESLKMSCEFGMGSADINSMYNVVCGCTFVNTPDVDAATPAWEARREKLAKDGYSEEELNFQEKNFKLLDAQRYFIPNSFDFSIESIGVYKNTELVKKACAIMQNKYVDMIQMIDSNELSILNSETAMLHSYDIILQNEDYTVGKPLEWMLYSNFYEGQQILNFCGFRKMHPTDADSVLRIAFTTTAPNTTKVGVKELLKGICYRLSEEVYADIYQKF